MITLDQVKNNKQILAYIKQSDIILNKLDYTYHGLSHVNVVTKRAGKIAQTFGFSKRKAEYAKIAGFCHDMANFIGRSQHHYWGALLFNQIFAEKTDDLAGLTQIMHAIASHDKDEKELVDKVTAAVVIADKSDVHRNRVRIHSRGSKNLQNDIHDRVNFAVIDNHLILDKNKKTIKLKLTIDCKMISVMDYFEIFIERMSYCKFSAQKIDCCFHLNINNFKLL
jgi:metal-dependent HD superfamily phosphatase/phosphodiesterase